MESKEIKPGTQKPLGLKDTETIEELRDRCIKWQTWYEASLEKIKAEYKENVKRFERIKQDYQRDRQEWRNRPELFDCGCHRINTIQDLHAQLVKAEACLKQARGYYYDDDE